MRQGARERVVRAQPDGRDEHVRRPAARAREHVGRLAVDRAPVRRDGRAAAHDGRQPPAIERAHGARAQLGPRRRCRLRRRRSRTRNARRALRRAHLKVVTLLTLNDPWTNIHYQLSSVDVLA